MDNSLCLSLSCSAKTKTHPHHPGGEWWLHDDHRQVVSRLVGARRLRFWRYHPITSSPTNQRPSPVAETVKNPPAMWDTWVQSLGWEKPLEESMATHASIPAWRIPQTEETGGLPSVGSHTAGHDQAMKQSHSEEGPQADHTSWTLSPHAVFKGLCQKASGGSGPCTWAACPPSWVPCKYTPSFLQTPAISLAFCTAGTRALAR